MSFGWSAGDIVAAVKLLYRVGVALKDSGGASSEYQDTISFLRTISQTLQHLNALQSTPISADLAENLREQCEHIRMLLQTFCSDIETSFEPTLGANINRKHIFAALRKLQWAFSTAKKVKRLQDRIALPMTAVGLMLGQQIVRYIIPPGFSSC
ncbi:uncharacterized protein BP5553_03544 [Venustampulla echinocandica]|uniref:Fungal N-terminal domain-containing protein n=1 Tax=Venustampulla echinocandica TaxID=2656787 RepID=A0A370TUK6_9HELO|nr:uncharacterized protein BP5553_03544 [Venustampulla echinocandica]RDL39204.1 hypothetical protein BP5553_03544 [Venustampulla echinocandica]